MRKQAEIDEPDSCFNKAAADEPIFVLRAADRLAPALVRVWAHLAELHDCPTEKTDDAMDLADAMEAWANRHRQGGKFPD